MNALIWAIGATVIVSLISLIGILSFSISGKFLNKLLFLLIGFSAGAMMGGAFLHLIPEALEKSTAIFTSICILVGFSTFFLIERVLHWHHCHEGKKCPVHMFTYMNLIGDGVHNFIDGLVISASFIVNVPLGMTTTIAVIAHEIPQELGDFGVLVYGGFGKAKALFFNFLSALTAVLGAVIGYFISSLTPGFTTMLVPFTAGGFIYIAASDLIPELHKEPKLKKSLFAFLFFLMGIAFIYVFRLIFE